MTYQKNSPPATSVTCLGQHSNQRGSSGPAPDSDATHGFMKTLDLQQAATFLHMNPETLRERAKAGLVPAAKPGKCWVFVEDDLVAYLRSLYADSRQAVQVSDQQETLTWHCTDVTRVKSGGPVSLPPMDSEYAKLLELTTASPPRNTKVA